MKDKRKINFVKNTFKVKQTIGYRSANLQAENFTVTRTEKAK